MIDKKPVGDFGLAAIEFELDVIAEQMIDVHIPAAERQWAWETIAGFLRRNMGPLEALPWLERLAQIIRDQAALAGISEEGAG